MVRGCLHAWMTNRTAFAEHVSTFELSEVCAFSTFASLHQRQVELRARRLLSDMDLGPRSGRGSEDTEKKSQEDAERLLVVSMVSTPVQALGTTVLPVTPCLSQTQVKHSLLLYGLPALLVPSSVVFECRKWTISTRARLGTSRTTPSSTCLQRSTTTSTATTTASSKSIWPRPRWGIAWWLGVSCGVGKECALSLSFKTCVPMCAHHPHPDLPLTAAQGPHV
jgi:hypothetical protein